tara:strand:- start:361 stop:903 length:543 start_codon:yes stop_codon:yes gene_type:complete
MIETLRKTFEGSKGKIAAAVIGAGVAFASFGLAANNAHAAGPARDSNEVVVDVKTKQAPANWNRADAHNWALSAAKGLDSLLLVYFGTNEKELENVVQGAKRTMDADGEPVVYGILQVRDGDGRVIAYAPNGDYLPFNQGGGDPMIKWTTSQRIITLYNDSRPDVSGATLAQRTASPSTN